MRRQGLAPACVTRDRPALLLRGLCVRCLAGSLPGLVVRLSSGSGCFLACAIHGLLCFTDYRLTGFFCFLAYGLGSLFCFPANRFSSLLCFLSCCFHVRL